MQISEAVERLKPHMPLGRWELDGEFVVLRRPRGKVKEVKCWIWSLITGDHPPLCRLMADRIITESDAYDFHDLERILRGLPPDNPFRYGLPANSVQA